MSRWSYNFGLMAVALLLFVAPARAQTDICDFPEDTTPASSACVAVHEDGVAGYHTPVSYFTDGENIQDDTIDDDSIDFTDVTAADITMTDAGAITSSGTVTLAGNVVFSSSGSAITLYNSGGNLTTEDGINSAEYCDEGGANCFLATDVGAGGGASALNDLSDVNTSAGFPEQGLLSYSSSAGEFIPLEVEEALAGTGSGSILIGDSNSSATQANTVAIGNFVDVTTAQGVGIGYNHTVSGANGIGIGNNPQATGGLGSISIGLNSTATQNRSVAIGNSADSTGVSAVAIGGDSTGDQDFCFAAGYFSNCNRQNTFTINGDSGGFGTQNLEVSGNIYNGGKSSDILTFTSSVSAESYWAGTTVFLDCASCTITIAGSIFNAQESFDIVTYTSGNSIAEGSGMRLTTSGTLNFMSGGSAAVRFVSSGQAWVAGALNAN